MAISEGVGIKAPSKRSVRLAGNLGASTPVKNYGGKFQQDFGAGRIKSVRPKPGFTLKDVYGAQADTTRPNFFSPDGGAFDVRNNVEVASLNVRPYISSDVSDDIEGYNNYLRENYATDMEGERYKSFSPVLKRTLRESYNQDRGYQGKEGDPSILINQKPSFVERTKELAGNIFNTYRNTICCSFRNAYRQTKCNTILK